MRYVRDTTGRFPQRPHYDLKELDVECEKAITGFMNESCGGFTFPIPTDVLTKLIERDADDLDLYADLSSEGPGVQGVTNFRAGQRPSVRIDASLSSQKSENRLRTTLTHEWGHVQFHNCLWQIEALTSSMMTSLVSQPSPRCKQEQIFSAPKVDWMEWQAGYVCGSVLMPLSHVRAVVNVFCNERGLFPPLLLGSAHAAALTSVVSASFAVSTEAAHVRLSKLEILSAKDLGPTLF